MDWARANDEQQQSLEGILAHRDSSRRLLMQLAQDAEQKKTKERQFGLDEEVRKGQLARQVAMDKTTAEDRDETRKVAQQARDLAAVKMIPRGTNISADEDIARVKSAGLGSRLTPQFKQVPMPNAGDVGPVDAPPIPNGQRFEGTADELMGEEKAAAAEQRAAALQSQRDVQNELSAQRAGIAQSGADLAGQRLEFDRHKNGGIQTFQGPDGVEHHFVIGQDGTATEVRMPEGFRKKPTDTQAGNTAAAIAEGRKRGTLAAAPLGPVQKIIDSIGGANGMLGSGRMQPVPAHAHTATSSASAAPRARKEIPGVPGGFAEEVSPGKWVRVQ